MRRLYHKIYLAIVASLILVVLAAGVLWRFGMDSSPTAQAFEMAGELVAAALPPADAPRHAQRQAIARLASRLGTDIALFDDSLAAIATAGSPLPRPSARQGSGGWIRGPGGPAWGIRLPDERWLVLRPPAHQQRHSAVGLIVFLGGVALAVALAAYPVVRGLTRRLERLQAGVETLGSGNLSARVEIEGRDEIAGLGESFNRAAARIEQLLGAHRMLLANASHELRTPLSRLRMGLELHQPGGSKAALEQDIAELNLLVDELLLASRLEADARLERTEEIDLLGLAAEECARYDNCSLEGEPALVRGDGRLLRRLIRNLVENARRHGRPPVRVVVGKAGERALLEVFDCGEGVPQAERERVFMPFHRLRPDAKGAGLGLSLVRQIARLHGGDAVVAPRPEEGSCFRVTLPLVT